MIFLMALMVSEKPLRITDLKSESTLMVLEELFKITVLKNVVFESKLKVSKKPLRITVKEMVLSESKLMFFGETIQNNCPVKGCL